MWPSRRRPLYDLLVREVLQSRVIHTDGLGRRIFKDVAGGSTDDRHYYYNEEWQLLETRKTETGIPVEQFVWHPYYIDALAMRFRDADGNGNLSESPVLMQESVMSSLSRDKSLMRFVLRNRLRKYHFWLFSLVAIVVTLPYVISGRDRP